MAFSPLMTDAFLEVALGIQLYRDIVCNTTDWMAYKQHKFISHSSGGWDD